VLLRSVKDFLLKGLMPLRSGIMLFGLLGWSLYFYGNPDQSEVALTEDGRVIPVGGLPG
jgi:hypothetical protein